MFLMGIKQCHRCNGRKGCTLKNSEVNLRDKPKKIKIIETPKIQGMPVPTEVTIASFCGDFDIERKAD